MVEKSWKAMIARCGNRLPVIVWVLTDESVGTEDDTDVLGVFEDAGQAMEAANKDAIYNHLPLSGWFQSGPNWYMKTSPNPYYKLYLAQPFPLNRVSRNTWRKIRRTSIVQCE